MTLRRAFSSLRAKSMKRLVSLSLLAVALAHLFVLVPDSPAALVWRKSEGWSWEGSTVTIAKTPKEQIELGRQYQAKKDYSNAIASYRRLIKRWPTSSAAQDARFGLAECLSARGYHFKAFQTYQELIDKHPNTEHFDEALQRQFEIGNLFLTGERDKAWGVRLFPAIDKSVQIFEQVVKNGPYSPTAPEAQFRIGLAYEKQRMYLDAVHAYEVVLDRYAKHPMAETAQFQMGYAYKQESSRAEYDKNSANQSIAAFSDFLIRYPKSDKAEVARQYLGDLKQEQSRGLFTIGEFYEKRKKYGAALIYYNEVLEQNPQSTWAESAKDKITGLTALSKPATATATP